MLITLDLHLLLRGDEFVTGQDTESLLVDLIGSSLTGRALSTVASLPADMGGQHSAVFPRQYSRFHTGIIIRTYIQHHPSKRFEIRTGPVSMLYVCYDVTSRREGFAFGGRQQAMQLQYTLYLVRVQRFELCNNSIDLQRGILHGHIAR